MGNGLANLDVDVLMRRTDGVDAPRTGVGKAGGKWGGKGDLRRIVRPQHNRTVRHPHLVDDVFGRAVSVERHFVCLGFVVRLVAVAPQTVDR